MTFGLEGLPRVSDVGGVQVESWSSALDGPPVDRLVLMAGWSPTAHLSRSTTTLIAALQAAGYQVVFGTTSQDPGVVTPHPEVAVDSDALSVVRRPNVGYDFGTWSVLVRLCDAHLGADKVLMVNDSLVGPFGPLTEIIAHFEGTSADVWGMVESGQITDHLQSFFRGFRYGCLSEPVLRAFWRDLRVIDDKMDLIREYEFSFAPFLRRSRYSSDYFVDFRGMVGKRHNPTIAGWRRLLEAGVPFVKRELVRRPDLVSDGASIKDVVKSMHGVDIDLWL